MIALDAWRPVSTAYGVCSNTESVSRREGAVSAVGIESSASEVIGKPGWVSVIYSRFRTRSEVRGFRGGRRVLWWRWGSGADRDLALNLAVRSQHDGIDWDRLVGPMARSQYDGIDWDRARGQGARVP